MGREGSFEYLETKKRELMSSSAKAVDEAPWRSADQLLLDYCFQPLAPTCDMSKRAEAAQRACIRWNDRMKFTKVWGEGQAECATYFPICLHASSSMSHVPCSMR